MKDDRLYLERAPVLLLPEDQPIYVRRSSGSSMRRELEALFAAAPAEMDQADLRELVEEQNVTGKATMAERRLVWKRLKSRYLLDGSVPEFRAFASEMRSTASSSDRGLLCLLMLARTDRLFREVTLRCVSPELRQAGILIDPAAVEDAIRARATEAACALRA